MFALAPGKEYRLTLDFELVVSCELNGSCSILRLEELDEAKITIEASHSILDSPDLFDRHVALKRCL